MKPKYAQNRQYLKGYTTEDIAMDFRRLSRLRGMSTSEHIRYLVDKAVNDHRSENHKVTQLKLF